MCLFFCRPAVPEEGDGEEDAKHYAGGETHFGFGDATVAGSEADDGCVREFGDGGDAEEKAGADADECETSHFGFPAVLAFEDGGDGRKEEV